MKKVKKAMAMLLVVIFTMGILPSVSFTVAAENNSRQLKVLGNKLVYADDTTESVRLTGVNIPGGEWTGTPSVERLTRSAETAINSWNCNVLRLGVSLNGWYGNYSYVHDGGSSYRNYIDSVIDIASEAGVYVILDFHHYKAFDNDDYLDFWANAAQRYKNNPTVLFGILNEPHSVGWEVWRNGNGSDITGHQQVVEMIRDLDAKNIIVAGGLDWGYDLTGITNGYALVDQGSDNSSEKAGYGIMYDSHIYPWKGRTTNWNNKVGEAREEYPVIIGECGWDQATNSSVGGVEYQPGDAMYHDRWVPELLDWMDDSATFGAAANYTAYSLHPSSAPRLIGDPDNWKTDGYSYPPTNYWGAYIKEHLAQCEILRRGNDSVSSISVENPKTDYIQNEEIDLITGSVKVTYTDGSEISIPLSTPGVEITGFDTTTAGSKTVTVRYKEKTATYSITVEEFISWVKYATFDNDADIVFASNAFDSRWSGQTSADTFVKSSANGLGIDDSNALGFDYARSGGWGGTQEGIVPSTWDWSQTKYISFYARIIPTTQNTSNTFTMNIAGTNSKCEFEATTNWQFFSFDFSQDDLTSATKLQWTVNNAGAGKLVIDNLAISNYELTDDTPVPTLESIAVSGQKTNYNLGNGFVRPTVTATYSDGSTEDVTADAVFTGYNMSQAGTQTVTVTYQGFTQTYSIIVSEAV